MNTTREQKIFDDFLKASQDKLPNVNLLDCCSVIEKDLLQIETTLQKCLDSISKEPFLAVFDIWVKKMGIAHGVLLDDSKTLLEHNFIKTTDNHGEIWTIGKAKEFDHCKILDEIRSEQKWSIRRKETLVQTYISFISWLCNQTKGYISKLDDPDQIRTANRAFKFGKFIEFLDAISNEKSQLIAKLLYFGEKQSLEEILSLKLDQVDFTKNIINYDSTQVQYPEHIFNYIKAIISPRETGYIFESRQSTKINQKTVFRNFQSAAEHVGLETPFSIKRLSINDHYDIN